MSGTVIQMSIQRMVCTGCGAEANASCNCGVSYVAKTVRAAEAIRANPGKALSRISHETGIPRSTLRDAESQLGAERHPDERREGRDGKSYSLRRRISDEPDLPAKVVEAAAATGRRRIFLRCAEDAVRKAEQGAGLKDAKQSEIDDEILMTLEKVIEAWTSLRNEILNRKGE